MSEQARKAIHDRRWGPYIDDPIERQEADDAMIRVVMDTFDQLEAENATLKRENRQLWDRLTVIEGFLRLKDLDLPGWSTDALLQESGF